MPDRSLQSLSLSCLLSYKSPHLIPYEDNFRSLLDDTKWRDELVLFDIGAIEAKDRPEVIGVLIRLLYGLLGERKGRGKGADKKSAILSALAACDEAELRILMDLMLKPFGGLERHLSPNSPLFEFHDVGETPLKQHVGFLMLLGDALPNLGARLLPYWPSLIGTTMDILHSSQRGIGGGVATGEIPEEDTPEDAEDEGDPTDTPEFGTRKPMRTARQLGLKRFADFFRSSTPFDFQPYMSSAFPSFISPRLPALKVESVQAPSALLELFYTWTNRRDTCFYFVDYDAAVLPEVFSCLTVPSVKPAVISRIFDLIDRLLMISSDDSEITTRVIHPNVGSLLSHVSTLSERIADPKSTVTDLARRQIGILSSLASYITNGDQATHLLQLFLPLLRKPVKMVPERTKVDVLTIIVNLLPQIPDIQNAESPMFIKTYSILSSLFHTLRTRQSRLALVDAFSKLVSAHPLLHTIAELITSLNAFSIKRSEEPDFDRRLAAFASLNESLYSDFSAQHWLPIIHNMLQFIQDADELAVRNSAALTLRRFVEMAATSHDGEITTLFDNVMYPGLRNALRSKLELVRTEVLGVLAYGIATCESQPALLEMRPLLAAGDEEANFFNNVHHVQIHRRTRALRRLAERCSDNQIRSITLAEVFVPLVEHFILGTGTADHHLVNEAISTMGKMAHSLAWGAYNMLVRKYLKLAQEKSSSERVFIRTVVAILENFHFNMNESVTQVENVDDEDEGLQEEHDDSNRETLTKARQTARIADAVNSRLLPTLLGYLEKREETEDTIRISVCPGIVKVAQHLPEPLKDAQISRLITILSQVFRSKSQETRDVARDTMGKIAVSLGPQYLPQIIKELRAALLRGPHLHILAFITHALLVQVTSVEEAEFNPDLDGCVVDVAHVSAEVIFGQSGKDLQSEDFRTKVREVRSSPSKGLDSFMILAKYITPPKLSILLHPIRAIMYETQTAKMMQKVDEVLGRIATGLNANKHLDPSNLLVLCHTLISQNAKFLTEAPQVKRPKHKVKAEFAVQIKRDVPKEGDHYAHNSAKLVAFGFDLFVTAFRRGRFDFRDDGILSRLEPMVPLIEKALHSNDAQVVSLALKVSAAVIKCPLAALDDSLQPIIQQTLDVIVQAGSSESEVVQTAFKSLGTIIRDNSKAVVKEKDLTFLLELITTDLEEVDRQAAAFSLLRAIVSRKLVVPEIYDLMEKVSDVMVTSQSTLAQELCRGVLLQFLLDYPQGKKRLQKHMAFLAKNLSYVFESGRKSVMELLSAVFSKFDEGLLREYNDLFFVALVMVIANDDSPKCREMAAELIKSLFLRSDADQRRALSGHLHSWTIQNQKPKLASVGAQVYGLFLDVLRQDAQPYLPNLLKDLRARIEQSAELFADLENSSADETDPMELDIDWQIAYQSLTSLAKALRHFPNLTTSIDNVPWNAIIGHCLFPHAWVRSAAARLIGVLFTAIPIAKPTNTGVMTKSTLMEIARLSCLQLRSPTLDKALGLQIVKNLFYLGKTFCLYTPLDGGASNRLGVKRDHAEDDEGNGDEESMGYDDAEQNEGGEPGDSVDTNENPLPWLFSKLSYQVRSALIKRRNHFLGTVSLLHVAEN
jgi:U3 small nucleolar RNA-associated protein 20